MARPMVMFPPPPSLSMENIHESNAVEITVQNCDGEWRDFIY